MSFASEIIWLQEPSARFPHLEPTPFHADNTSANQIAVNSVFHERIKHIEVDCHSTHEAYDDRAIILSHVTTAS